MIGLFLFCVAAFANSLGVEDPADPPSSRRVTWRLRDFKQDIGDDIPLPAYVVPLHYARNGRVRIGKYYDAEGHVYSFQEALILLDECGDPCEDALDEYDRRRAVQATWSVVGVLGTLFFLPVGIAADVVVLSQTAPLTRAFSDGVHDYNRREIGRSTSDE